jgi:hypothetical protein
MVVAGAETVLLVFELSAAFPPGLKRERVFFRTRWRRRGFLRDTRVWQETVRCKALDIEMGSYKFRGTAAS